MLAAGHLASAEEPPLFIEEILHHLESLNYRNSGSGTWDVTGLLPSVVRQP